MEYRRDYFRNYIGLIANGVGTGSQRMGMFGKRHRLVSKNPNLLQSSYSENGFAAYPNPVHGSLYLTVPNGTPVPCPVKLYSAAGVLIDHFLLMHTGTNAVESVSHCDPGVYYLEIAAGELRHSTQIVVY